MIRDLYTGVLSAWNGLRSLGTSDFSSFKFWLKRHRGLCQLPYLQKAHHPISQLLQSTHHNLCLLSYLLNVLLLGNIRSTRVKSATVWIPAGAPAHNRDLVHMECRVCSCLLPLEVWDHAAQLACSQLAGANTPAQDFVPFAWPAFPVLTSHIFQEAVFGWAPG